ncbi:MAG TPA: hypothetical protein VFB72_01290 [Verrucomicrobiae bacterium]|nr:hypothetical protein [Verrucomicrobiae bacterium]
MNENNQPPQSTGGQEAKWDKPTDLKSVAIELFKKSQRLPPISLIIDQAKAKGLVLPPKGFELAEFYHL